MIIWNCNGTDMLLDHERQTVEGRLVEIAVVGTPGATRFELCKVYAGLVRVEDGNVWIRTTLNDRLLGTIDHAAVEARIDKLTS